jgi:Uma2 family endonuclease
MPETARRMRNTYEQYRALEEQSGIRHEYLDGEIYAMATGTPDHAALAARLIQLLGARVPPGCRVYTSDLRVFIARSGLITYPDVSVACGPTVRAAVDPLAIENPVLLVEITSPSTEDYDRGEKLRHYKLLHSLREVLIVSHREARLSLHRRSEAGWTELLARAGETLELSSLGARLAVDEVYADGLEDALPSA